MACLEEQDQEKWYEGSDGRLHGRATGERWDGIWKKKVLSSVQSGNEVWVDVRR